MRWGRRPSRWSVEVGVACTAAAAWPSKVVANEGLSSPARCRSTSTATTAAAAIRCRLRRPVAASRVTAATRSRARCSASLAPGLLTGASTRDHGLPVDHQLGRRLAAGAALPAGCRRTGEGAPDERLGVASRAAATAARRRPGPSARSCSAAAWSPVRRYAAWCSASPRAATKAAKPGGGWSPVMSSTGRGRSSSRGRLKWLMVTVTVTSCPTPGARTPDGRAVRGAPRGWRRHSSTSPGRRPRDRRAGPGPGRAPRSRRSRPGRSGSARASSRCRWRAARGDDLQRMADRQADVGRRQDPRGPGRQRVVGERHVLVDADGHQRRRASRRRPGRSR